MHDLPCVSVYIPHGHNFIGIDVVSQKARRDLNRSVAKGKGALRQLEKIISDIESGFLVNLKEVRNKEIEKIQTTKKVVEGLLDIVTETTTNDIDSFIHVQKDKLMTTLRKAEMLRKEYGTVISTLEKLSEITHDTTYLCFYLKQKDDLLKLDDISVCDKPATVDEFQAIDFFREVVAKINERFECNVLEKEEEQNHDQIITKLNAEIKELKEENQRLSKLAGQKLTEKNPNITNLSDPNRPMKLSEAYSELYDNDWTDTMDLCTKKIKKFSEDNVVQALNGLLLCCYRMCKQEANVSVEKSRIKIKEVTHVMLIPGLETQVEENVVDIRRGNVELSANKFCEVLQKNHKSYKEYFKELDTAIYDFVKGTLFFDKCVKLCWKMILQDPPMTLEVAKKGDTIDKNVYREYTSSGKTVVFSVWPALLLHENGPLLIKGVVKVK